ncbi:MAG: HD domain protein, partial [uncultured Rubrobacteraceae bacterium]
EVVGRRGRGARREGRYAPGLGPRPLPAGARPGRGAGRLRRHLLRRGDPARRRASPRRGPVQGVRPARAGRPRQALRRGRRAHPERRGFPAAGDAGRDRGHRGPPAREAPGRRRRGDPSQGRRRPGLPRRRRPLPRARHGRHRGRRPGHQGRRLARREPQAPDPGPPHPRNEQGYRPPPRRGDGPVHGRPGRRHFGAEVAV